MPTPRQIELDKAFERIAESAGWNEDPDRICARVAKNEGASEQEVYDAVCAVIDATHDNLNRLAK